MHEMMTGMVFAKYMLIPKKESGLFFDLGYDHTVEFVKKDYPSIWVSLNLFSILAEEVKLSLAIFFKLYSLQIREN